MRRPGGFVQIGSDLNPTARAPITILEILRRRWRDWRRARALAKIERRLAEATAAATALTDAALEAGATVVDLVEALEKIRPPGDARDRGE